MEGLASFDVLKWLRQFPSEAKELLLPQQVTVALVESILVPSFSEVDSNDRAKEEQIYVNWVRFLKACKRERVVRGVSSVLFDNEIKIAGSDTQVKITVNDVLQFATGSKYPPIKKVARQITV